MAKNEIREFAIPMLPSNSIKDTTEFYRALGCTITYQQKAPNNYIGLKIKGIEVHFFGLKLKPESNFSSCYLRVDDIETFYTNCRSGLKKQYGKIPLKGIPRINPLKDIPAYGVRQFVIVDPSGNYIRIGQPIVKENSVLFEENDVKPKESTALEKAFELACRLANGKDDLTAAANLIDRILTTDNGTEKRMLFRLIALRLDIAYRDGNMNKIQELLKRGNSLLTQIKDTSTIAADVQLFNTLSSELKQI
ncbi:bleomycin resistance protein [Fulvivirga imtechensis AK7]|uniref:Bleomycin resistance protein n=1 Tax=Fulvivirga imtechensis AK7 TaxID=1237149 RepID=L8JUA1_9BACT|nr:VOC family protein [Fulvivirga imtechensis]ELR71129.1 bleomycin resistance protein [Fulvivirga imtechensis AK7]